MRTKLYDCYDDLTEATTLRSVCRVLTTAFEQYDIKFVTDPNHYQGLHPKSFKEIGIVEAEIDPLKRIKVKLWSEILYTLQEPKRFERFVRLMSALIRHEFVHREQTVRSNAMCHQQNLPRFLQEKEEWVVYYGDRHELGAMAQEIIKELSKSHSSTLSRASMRYCDIMEHCDIHVEYKNLITRRLKKTIYQVLCN